MYNTVKNQRTNNLHVFLSFPEKNWCYYGLSRYISCDIIDMYPKKPWCWENISRNCKITHEFIEKNIDKNWNWVDLSANPVVTPEFIEKHFDWQWVWWSVSSNPSLYIEFVKNNLNLPWCFDTLSSNPAMTPNIITENDFKWNWKYVTNNPSITDNFIIRYQNMNWNWTALSSIVSTIVVDTLPDKPWLWGSWGLSDNKNINLDFIQKHCDKQWDYAGLFGNSSVITVTQDILNSILSMKLVHLHPIERMIISNIQGKKKYLSSNHSLTDNIVINNKNFPWHFGHNGLSNNLSLTFYSVYHTMDKEWDFEEVSRNIVSKQDIIDFPGMDWNWNELSHNERVHDFK